MSWWVPYDQLLSLAGTRLSTNKSNERHVPGRTTRTIGAAKDLHLLLQQCPVRKQEDEERETRTWVCPVRAEWGVPWQQTVKLIKVKTWTWHSNLTELAYLDVSMCPVGTVSHLPWSAGRSTRTIMSWRNPGWGTDEGLRKAMCWWENRLSRARGVLREKQWRQQKEMIAHWIQANLKGICLDSIINFN